MWWLFYDRSLVLRSISFCAGKGVVFTLYIVCLFSRRVLLSDNYPMIINMKRAAPPKVGYETHENKRSLDVEKK